MTGPVNIPQLLEWVREAGQIALEYYYRGVTRTYKADRSPVTQADIAVERYLTGRIRQTYPGPTYGLMAEESTQESSASEFLWVIDPIDGTRVFADGLPLWSVSIGLLHRGQPYRGVVYLPATDEMYFTDENGVPFWNRRPLRGLMRTAWDRDSFIAVPSTAHRCFRIDFHRLRALGSIAAHYMYVARGAAVAVLHRRFSLWDIAAAYTILAACGGCALHLNGEPVSLVQLAASHTANRPVLAGHPEVVSQLLGRVELIAG